MPDLNSETVSAAIRGAPAFARIGLSMLDPNLRERAVGALAAAIVERLRHPSNDHDENQMPLPL